MLLRDEVHKRSATEHRPVHVVLPSPVPLGPGLGPSSVETIPLRGLEGVPGLPGAPQDEAGLTRKFETSHVGGWEGLGAGGEGDDRGLDGWMASLTRWT